MADMTNAQMAQAIAQGINHGMQELAKTLKPQNALDQAGLSPERKAQILDVPPSQKYREIPWQSQETGATGIAHVIESRGMKNGRITRISGYTRPREAYVKQSDGGRVPDGFEMWREGPMLLPEDREPPPGIFNPVFNQWLWETFYQADLRFYIGREIQAHHCKSSDGLATKWQESRVGAISDA
jgi:hypothetical protein